VALVVPAPLLLLLLHAATPAAASAQGLRGKISSLFIFSEGDEPLFLAGSADPSNPASLQAHGRHFVPASAAENASVIGFLTDAVGSNVANVPIGSTSGSATFRFEGGVPVKTSASAGPIFAERAETIGRGHVLAGISRSAFTFSTLRGVSLNDLQLVFTHQNVDFPGCSTTFQGDCSKMGVPTFENDVIDLRLTLDIDVRATSFYVTYGLTDRLDVAAVVPFVQTRVRGESAAQIVPFGGTTAAHFFAGTTQAPVLGATRESQGTAAGVGDVAVRLKANLRESPRTSVALLADARFPTGSTDDLLGSGSFAARGLAIVSSRFGDFSPHVNAGYLYRGSDLANDAILGTVGFDQRLAEKVTLAADLVSELQVGTSALVLPKRVAYEVPFRRTVNPTSIPDLRDDVVNGSFGAKFTTGGGFTLIVNSLFPLNHGGLRPDVTWTAGVEYGF
jgi:Putative MetA-pathway of phenol degradation